MRMKITNTASETIGTTLKRKTMHECPLIEQLSKQQHQLRLDIANTACQTKRPQLKAQRNRILEQIRIRQRENEIADFERRTTEIKKLKDGARMFRAVKELTSAKPKTPVVKNNAGDTIAQPEEAAEIVAGHFSNLFYASTTS